MKLKTLLLGSAAAMIAVTGARAADAVIVEPEPVEYVRVCDMYGAGFFYIPGTETCLKFDGYVRADYTYGTEGEVDSALAGVDNDFTNSSYSRFDYRVRFNIDARNETDYGTLRSQIRFQGDGNGGADAAVGVDRALISLGGLRLGYSDSFTTTFHGYGNPVEKYDGYYGYDQAIFLDYTYRTGGFEVAAGIQESVGAGATLTNPHVDWDYYVGAKYSADLGYIAASYIYEENVDEGAWKVSAQVTPFDGRLLLKAWYIGDENGATSAVSGTGEWAWGAGAAFQATDTLGVRVAYTDRDQDTVIFDPSTGTSAAYDDSYFTAGLNWTPVPGLAIRPEARIWTESDRGQDYSVRVYRTF